VEGRLVNELRRESFSFMATRLMRARRWTVAFAGAFLGLGVIIVLVPHDPPFVISRLKSLLLPARAAAVHPPLVSMGFWLDGDRVVATAARESEGVYLGLLIYMRIVKREGLVAPTQERSSYLVQWSLEPGADLQACEEAAAGFMRQQAIDEGASSRNGAWLEDGANVIESGVLSRGRVIVSGYVWNVGVVIVGVVTLIALWMSSVAWVRVRRSASRLRRGECVRCGYSMEGVGACPECGLGGA
jgi:hypothetical protein